MAEAASTFKSLINVNLIFKFTTVGTGGREAEIKLTNFKAKARIPNPAMRSAEECLQLNLMLGLQVYDFVETC